MSTGEELLRDYKRDRTWRLVFPLDDREYFSHLWVSVNPLTDEIYISDHFNHQVHKLNKDGLFEQSFGSFDSLPLQFNKPEGIVCNGEDCIVIDSGNHRFQLMDTNFTQNRPIGFKGEEKYGFSVMRGIALSKSRIYLSNSSATAPTSQIKIFNRQFPNEILAVQQLPEVKFLYGIALNSKEEIFVSDCVGNKISKINKLGQSPIVIGKDVPGGLDEPTGIAIDSNDCLLVCDSKNCRIVVLDTLGNYSHEIETQNLPMDIDIQSNGTLVVSQFHANQVGDKRLGYVTLAEVGSEERFLHFLH